MEEIIATREPFRNIIHYAKRNYHRNIVFQVSAFHILADDPTVVGNDSVREECLLPALHLHDDMLLVVCETVDVERDSFGIFCFAQQFGRQKVMLVTPSILSGK